MPRSLKELKQFQAQLVINATKSELKLQNQLVALGYKFNFQHIIEPFIIDFYFPQTKSIVELDSPRFHNPIKDASRDLYLTNSGCRILRIKSYRVFKDMKGVLKEIEDFLSD